jgi:hypothetical protein
MTTIEVGGKAYIIKDGAWISGGDKLDWLREYANQDTYDLTTSENMDIEIAQKAAKQLGGKVVSSGKCTPDRVLAFNNKMLYNGDIK